MRTERRLAARGPELLDMMRTGRRPASSSMTFKLPEMPKTARTVTMTCWTLGAIPLFPQGILAAVFLTNGQLEHSWFLATYMSPGLRWPTAVFMILLGLTMYGLGLWIPARYRKVA